MKELKYLNKYFYKYRLNLLLGVVIVIIARILLLFTPGLVRNSINIIDQYRRNLIIDQSIVENELIQNIFLILLAAVLSGFFTFLTRQTIINVSRHIEFDLKNEIYCQYQNLSLNFYKRNKTGDLMNRISEDVSRVRMYVGPAVMYSMNTITLLIIVIFYMYRQSPELTFYTICPLPILSITIYKLSKLINQRSTIVQESLSKLSSYTQEIFTGIQIVKSYVIQDKTSKSFDDLSSENKMNQINLAKVQALFFPLMILLIGLSNLLVIYIGGKQYLDGTISDIGIIAEFIIYVNMLTWPVASIGWISSIIQQAEASQKRINEFLKQRSEITNFNPNDTSNILGEITFNNVNYKYRETGIAATNNISFSIKSIDKLGITGSTGSGKSTLMNLLCRLYDVDDGEILIDNIPVKEINLNSLRKQIGYVPQDTFLFSDTIMNNVKFGIENATKDEVIKACKTAAIHNEISNFEKGYDTILGERGINLSGGQKQRISIARALIKKPKILILDDCLSAMDTQTEELILKSLDSYTKNISTIIISHRISSIKNANNIIVLENGSIIQSGTHNQLISQNGYYKHLYNKQIIKKESIE
ncbi:MAG: ABC transporter ATP-binding protein [Flavobacteriaceae bacterium]|nr:ABC transporter ATP-binding protein [Flavobacteriaceae bacterium]